MSNSFDRFWWNWGDAIKVFLSVFIFFASLLLIAGSALLTLQSNTLKYNCNLDYGPSLKTSLLISSGDFAYNPEAFCLRLKGKMEEE